MTGIELIAKEREEQLGKHQRSITNDVLFNIGGQLTDAACTLINRDQFPQDDWNMLMPYEWHYATWRHMINKPYLERLVIAGALIAAEIDRVNNKLPE